MTHTKDEPLKLALDALSSIDIYLSDTLSGRVNPDPATYKQWLIEGIIEARNRSRAAIAAIKQAVSAPTVQEPEYVQLRHIDEHGDASPWGQPLDPKERHTKWAKGVEMRLLYITPLATPAPVPLTDEQIVAKALHLSGLGTNPDVLQFARAIEAAHGITVAPEKGQP